VLRTRSHTIHEITLSETVTGLEQKLIISFFGGLKGILVLVLSAFIRENLWLEIAAKGIEAGFDGFD
jgi:hypothetical protein